MRIVRVMCLCICMRTVIILRPPGRGRVDLPEDDLAWTGLVASEREAERDQSPDSTESRSERRGERWDRWGNNAESIASSHILKFHSIQRTRGTFNSITGVGIDSRLGKVTFLPSAGTPRLLLYPSYAGFTSRSTMLTSL